jgi:ubiquinone/menaquinone biosynthesis C-methylase UbiE
VERSGASEGGKDRDVMETQSAQRRGRIDDFNLATLDLTKFASSKSGSSAFVEAGFHKDARYFRDYIAKWHFAGLRDVVDVGCGYGRWSFFLAEANSTVRAFDNNEERLTLGRNLVEHFALDNILFEMRDVTSLGTVDRQFSAAWCYNALQFVHRRKCLEQIHKILSPGGYLFLGMYEGSGKVLEKFFKGYALGGSQHRITKFATRSLAQGPRFSEGTPNYGDPDTIAGILNEFGFKLDSDFPLEVEMSRRPSQDEAFAEELRDLRALGTRLSTDEDFAATFAQHPGVASRLPMCLNLRAKKV